MAPAQVREPGQGVKRMLRITRDKTELGDAPFITFNVYRSPKGNRTICGYHEFTYQASGRKAILHWTPLGIRVAQAFEDTRRYAESKGISAIWVNDPNRLFEMERM